MNKRIFSILITVAAFSAVCLFSSASDAHEFTPRECQAFARDITFIGTLRDEGAKQVEVIDNLMPVMNAYRGNPASYIKDDEDIEMMVGVIRLVYEHPGVDPDTIGKITFQSCTGIASGAPIKSSKPRITT